MAPRTWANVVDKFPGTLYDATGYGVVKYESNIDLIYDINYRRKVEFYEFVREAIPTLNWVCVGTAFEYDLRSGAILENSPRIPFTHYGISKLMFTRYLEETYPAGGVTALIPFGMFGPREDHSKIVPTLIRAQKLKQPVELSSGTQVRDYLYVRDLARLAVHAGQADRTPGESVLKLLVGSGQGVSIKRLATSLVPHLPEYDPALWMWDAIAARENESPAFYSDSDQAQAYGLTLTPLDTALAETVDYYWHE